MAGDRVILGVMWRWLCLILLTLTWDHGAAAQDAAAPPAHAEAPAPRMADVSLRLREGGVMPALVMLERVIAAEPATAGQAAQWWAYSGDTATADALFARSMRGPGGSRPDPSGVRPQPALEAIDFSGVRPEPALEAIVRKARDKRIVVINEAHHAPRHRAFTHQLMAALRKEGFTHFAAETFCTSCPVLLANGVPTARDGPYILDPVFADLARQAASVGYTLVSYEIRSTQFPPPGTSPEEMTPIRELAQATNLRAALDADPNMRVLVHVGFGHLNEAPLGTTEMFAAQLRNLTGIDPLTIDQTEGTRQADHYIDTRLYAAFVAAFGEPQVPVVIDNDPEAPLGNYSVDLSVIHPTQRDIGGRPDWLAMGGYRKAREIRLEPLAQRSLLQAFVAREPAGAIAMDQMLVGSGAEAVTLMLPPGNYRLVRQTEAGEDLALGTVTVE